VYYFKENVKSRKAEKLMFYFIFVRYIYYKTRSCKQFVLQH